MFVAWIFKRFNFIRVVPFVNSRFGLVNDDVIERPEVLELHCRHNSYFRHLFLSHFRSNRSINLNVCEKMSALANCFTFSFYAFEVSTVVVFGF